MDEGYTINAVLSINEKGASILDSGQPYSCPTYCYPTAYITQIFGDNAFAYRFLSAIFGILFILVIFYIIRKIFNWKIAILPSFFVTFSYWQIAWSRQARWYTMFSVFFWLALFGFYQTLYAQKYKKWYALFTVIFTALAILTHGLGYLLPFIFFAWFLVDQIFIKKSFNWKKSAFSAIILIIAIFTLEYVFRLNFLTPLFNKISFHYELPYYLSFYLRTYWLFIILSLIALNLTDSKYKNQIWYLTLVFLSYFLSLSFLSDIVHYRYLFHVMPVLFVLTSVAIVPLASPDVVSDRVRNVCNWKVIGFLLAVLAIFFTVGGGVIVPQNTYYLESDNSETLGSRPFYSYTPQPDWNSAYGYIKNNLKENDIVISSHPQFNKIFLNQPGYWIQYDYLGMTGKENIITNDGGEYYVNAKTISNLTQLKSLMQNNHGYIIFDYMAIDGKIPKEIIGYIQTNTKQVFYQKTNAFSKVWVYRF
jgi:hypothetical protein